MVPSGTGHKALNRAQCAPPPRITGGKSAVGLVTGAMGPDRGGHLSHPYEEAAEGGRKSLEVGCKELKPDHQRT